MKGLRIVDTEYLENKLTDVVIEIYDLFHKFNRSEFDDARLEALREYRARLEDQLKELDGD